MLTQARQEEVLNLIKDLIAQKSYSGEEGGAAEVLKAYMLSHGYDDVMVDDYGNVIGKIVGKRPGPKVLFDGHIDTVPVANPAAWTKKPFEPEIIDGKLYGRGTSDMKGSVGSFTAAVGFFAADCDKDFAGELYAAGVVHEECFEGVAARSISKIVKPDYVIIGEASMCNLKIGQRGRGEIMVETFGIPAHSANPDKGLNAVYAMCKVVDAIRTLPATEHPVLGKGILELTDIKSNPYPGASVVPSYCKATYDRRLLVGETPESVIAPLQKLVDDLMAADPTIKAKVSCVHGEEMCYTGNKIEGDRFFPGWLYSENDDFVQAILGELHAIGQDPEITQYSFCTNGSHYAGEAGIKTIGYGPSRENLAHTDDEYAEVSELLKVAEGDYAICKALCK
jgi:putative selenium metabolism hydrolase